MQGASFSPSESPPLRRVQLPADRGRAPSRPEERAGLEEVLSLTVAPVDRSGRAVFLAALVAVLYRYTGQSDLFVDVYVEGDGGNATGHALEWTVGGETSVSALVSSIAEDLASLDLRGGGSAVRRLRERHPEPLARGEPRSNIAVTFLPGGDGPDARRPASETVPYELHLVVTATEHAARLSVLYDATTLRASTVRDLVQSLEGALTQAAAHDGCPLRGLSVAGTAAVQRLALEWDDRRAAHDEEPVHRRFEAFAREQPEAIAARFEGETLSYAELDRRANRLARHLIAEGVGAGSRIAVCVPPGFEILVALLAILKAGAVYVPLDPTHPKAMIASILDEAAPQFVLTVTAFRDFTAHASARHFCFDADRESVGAEADRATFGDVGLDAPSHLFYTSGTTGRPKGVLATHRNLAHYVHIAREAYDFGPTDVFCALARYTFSISLFELLSPLACGGSLRIVAREDVLSPARLARVLEEVTVVHAGPSLLNGLFRYLRGHPSEPRSFPGIRHASSGGDLVPPHLMEEMKTVFERAELFVIYGSTEISCMGCTYAIPRDRKIVTSFVGKPFPDVTVRVVDDHRNLVPFGVTGEICFSGKGVVPGYFENPELTSERFVELEGRRFYRMGDVGRLHADGNLEILGRRDFQVQIRGMRVELAGIENMVRELGLASQCAVVERKLEDGDTTLCAFVVGAREPDIARFRRALSALLPDYMLPQRLVVLDAFPVTHNGKLDRRRLREMPWDAPAPEARHRATPESALEREIASVFARTLGVAEVGVDEDFFDLGGHSLLAVLLLEELENELGVTFPPSAVLGGTTVRALAGHAANAFDGTPRPILLSRDGTRPRLFMLAGVHLYRALARALEDRYATYGVYAGKELLWLDSARSAPSVEDLASEYLDIVRREQPVGPYRLGGVSFGGIVAYEVARQLRAAGEEVWFLALVDAVLPDVGMDGLFARLRRLAALPAAARWHTLSSHLASRVRRVRKPPPEFVRYQDDARLRPMEDTRQQAYRRAADAYVRTMLPLSCATTLIVAGKRLERDPLLDPACGWTDYVPFVDVHAIDAEHLELLEPPHVDAVARLCLEALARADEPGAEGHGRPDERSAPRHTTTLEPETLARTA
jgi:amino acid adenylation domain-containing protein